MIYSNYTPSDTLVLRNTKEAVPKTGCFQRRAEYDKVGNYWRCHLMTAHELYLKEVFICLANEEEALNWIDCGLTK